jgi:hypothetical protein
MRIQAVQTRAGCLCRLEAIVATACQATQHVRSNAQAAGSASLRAVTCCQWGWCPAGEWRQPRTGLVITRIQGKWLVVVVRSWPVHPACMRSEPVQPECVGASFAEAGHQLFHLSHAHRTGFGTAITPSGHGPCQTLLASKNLL